jgi:hypothetical protein
MADEHGEQVVIDLVAEPVPHQHSPIDRRLGSVSILVDTPQEILANELATLLHRAEIRDLIDVRDLLRAGRDLSRGLEDAARKDGGFSPLTVGWSLASFPVTTRSQAVGIPPDESRALEEFRQSLQSKIAALARPPE